MIIYLKRSVVSNEINILKPVKHSKKQKPCAYIHHVKLCLGEYQHDSPIQGYQQVWFVLKPNIFCRYFLTITFLDLQYHFLMILSMHLGLFHVENQLETSCNLFVLFEVCLWFQRFDEFRKQCFPQKITFDPKFRLINVKKKLLKIQPIRLIHISCRTPKIKFSDFLKSNGVLKNVHKDWKF